MNQLITIPKPSDAGFAPTAKSCLRPDVVDVTVVVAVDDARVVIVNLNAKADAADIFVAVIDAGVANGTGVKVVDVAAEADVVVVDAADVQVDVGVIEADGGSDVKVAVVDIVGVNLAVVLLLLLLLKLTLMLVFKVIFL